MVIIDELPAVDIRINQFPSPAEISRKIGCSETTAKLEINAYLDARKEIFWEEVDAAAKHILGEQAKVESRGRNSGWLVIVGLYPPSRWNGNILRKWHEFEELVKYKISCGCSLDEVCAAIEEQIKHKNSRIALLFDLEKIRDQYVAQQGWNEDSLIIHLMGLVSHIMYEYNISPDRFKEYFDSIAKEENVNNICAGDEIRIDNGNPESPTSVIVSSIEYLNNDTVRIVTTEGETIECLLKEILFC